MTPTDAHRRVYDLAKACRVDGCAGTAHGHGLCSKHYQRMRNHGSLDLPARRKTTRRCTVNGCTEKHLARGFCNKHLLRYQAGKTLDDALLAVTSLPGERWKPIEGYESLYEVSDYGRIRRSPDGKLRPGAEIAPVPSGSGYLTCNLYKQGRMKGHKIHRLVAAAFIGPSAGLHVNHKNFVKTDNRLINLEYVTVAENNAHAIAGGRSASKLTRSQVKEMRRAYASGKVTQRQLAARYGVHPQTVSSAIRGASWGHVPGALGVTP